MPLCARKGFAVRARLTTGSQMLEAMGRVGVDAALLVATSHYGWDNSYSVEAALSAPDRFRVVGRLNPDAEDVEEQMAEWAASDVAAGLRILVVSDEIADRINVGNFDRFFCAIQLIEPQ